MCSSKPDIVGLGRLPSSFFMCPPHLICNIAGVCCLDYNILFRSLCGLHVM
ncbi:hypothetical protein PAHAL_1G416100 [Panicum hallii]|uniref:Uncharacterized protein n=1 Tax=Panicum hallii TaxID=206008 RepID=A0A2T8KXZ4_9POAL|nr:hypothetical protein PAHAL_1G416100 [Panicum hallii]